MIGIALLGWRSKVTSTRVNTTSSPNGVGCVGALRRLSQVQEIIHRVVISLVFSASLGVNAGGSYANQEYRSHFDGWDLRTEGRLRTENGQRVLH